MWKQTSESKREYPSAMIRRLVNDFVHDLRPPQLHMFLSTEKDIPPAERERLQVSGGHVSKTSLRLLLQRRGCPVWMQQMVDQLQCDSYLESSDAQNAQQVSLATPPKLWQVVKVDIFELEDSPRKGYFALHMDAACKLSSCSCFLEGNPRQRFEPNGATLISHLAKDKMQHFPQFQFFDFGPWWMFRQCRTARMGKCPRHWSPDGSW